MQNIYIYKSFVINWICYILSMTYENYEGEHYESEHQKQYMV